jgi:uncharacterized protein (TIGR02145 family)
MKMKIFNLNIYRLQIIIVFGIFIIPVLLNSCKKDNTSSAIEYGSVTDIDSNVYKTVKIGNQWWMAENLNVKRYRNGDTIINVGNRLDSAIWNRTITGAYYQGSIGLLYNWYAAGDQRNIAPAGWHVPTDDEWKELEMQVGMSKEDADKINWRGADEGNKLKIQGEGSSVWSNPTNKYEVWGTNESGFSATGDGCVMFNGILGQPGANYEGFWWTSTEQGNDAWYRYLDYNKPNVFRFYGAVTYGFSIRCVKDNSSSK